MTYTVITTATGEGRAEEGATLAYPHVTDISFKTNEAGYTFLLLENGEGDDYHVATNFESVTDVLEGFRPEAADRLYHWGCAWNCGVTKQVAVPGEEIDRID